jgi:hypothetical protein
MTPKEKAIILKLIDAVDELASEVYLLSADEEGRTSADLHNLQKDIRQLRDEAAA